ncbi:MAG: hypothetical protein F2817_17050, partial [Actinobacteria bacterium]|nr:hypothetical protein [Actinomycetota bacterium]
LLAGLLVVGLSASAVAGSFERVAAEVPKKVLPFPTQELPRLDEPEPGRPQTILLTGLDHRYADGSAPSRSDTMILMRLDPEAKATTILTLPRDLRAVVPGHGTGTQKLNGAWALGGAKLLTRTLRTSLLGTPEDPFRINNVVSIRFDAFAKAVNHFRCLYSDIDRRYLVRPGAGYAEIDQAAGYQLLCGMDSLAYVRFRHQDSDLTRAARQATFVAEARNQVDAGDVLLDAGDLLDAIGPFVQTSVRSARQLLGVAKLAVNLTNTPTKRVELGTTLAEDGSGDVLTTPAALAKARREFLEPTAVRAARPATRSTTRRRGSRTVRRSPAALPASMVRDAPGATQLATAVRPAAGRLPILAPSARLSRGAWQPEMSRGYWILDRSRRPRWPAYRLVASTGIIGEYYGVEGTTWRTPPILGLATDAVRLNGRTWRVQHDGRAIRRLFRSTPDGTFWISNSLTNELNAREMYALARSFGHRAGPTPRRAAGDGAGGGTATTTTAPTPSAPTPAGPPAPSPTAIEPSTTAPAPSPARPAPAIPRPATPGTLTVPRPSLLAPSTLVPRPTDLAPLGPGG